MRNFIATLVVLVLTLPGLAGAGSGVVTMHHDPNCGCCGAWAEHMRESGFEVVSTPSRDMQSIKRAHGLPAPLASCHTATVDGYVIEGHVPAADVQRLLKERPDVAGIAVPGMPLGSPGMEVDGRKDPYDVIVFDDEGRMGIFARH